MNQESESIFILQAEKIIQEIFNNISENLVEKVLIKTYKDEFSSEPFFSQSTSSLYSVIAKDKLIAELQEEKACTFVSDAITEDSFVKFIVIYFDSKKEKQLQRYTDFCECLKNSIFDYLLTQWKNNNYYFYNSSISDILTQNATNTLITEVSKKCCGYNDIALYENINLSMLNILSDLSYLTYEKSNSQGLIYFTDNISSVEFQFKFADYEDIQQFTLGNIKMIRKLLELTNVKRGYGIISDTNKIYGIGTIKENNSYYSVTFEEDHKWILAKDTTELLVMKDNSLVFSSSKLSVSDFKSYLSEVFPHKNTEEPDYVSNILAIIKSLIKQDKGTILVVLKDAQNYINRYKDLSLLIEPVKLDEKNVEKLSSIDGAIIMDENCICYGFGVVLDGKDTGFGNRARGSRYNSSERFYHYCKEEDSAELFVFILSDDGNWNFFPPMKP